MSTLKQIKDKYALTILA